MENENKKLTPLKFLTDSMEMSWGTVEYRLADLGFVDSMAGEGWLGGKITKKSASQQMDGRVLQCSVYQALTHNSRRP